jgi:hypothetical protein
LGEKKFAKRETSEQGKITKSIRDRVQDEEESKFELRERVREPERKKLHALVAYSTRST